MNELQTTFAPDAESLARATAAASTWLSDRGIGAKSVYDFELVLEELAVNAMRYGDIAPADVEAFRLEISLEENGRTRVRLSDKGRSFDPRREPASKKSESIEETTIGGRGLDLVRKRAPDLEWRYEDGRNVIEFTL